MRMVGSLVVNPCSQKAKTKQKIWLGRMLYNFWYHWIERPWNKLGTSRAGVVVGGGEGLFLNDAGHVTSCLSTAKHKDVAAILLTS